MDFRVWLETVQEMSIESILMTRSELLAAVENIVRGYPAQTSGPVEVAYLKSAKKYQLVNGYHRMVQFMLDGRDKVLVNIKDADWKIPSESDRFVFQPDMKYAGLEEFIEPYILRKLGSTMKN